MPIGFLHGARRKGSAALFFAALAGSALMLAGCGSKPIASVNGTNLTEEEFHALCENATHINPQSGTVGLQVLEQWIRDSITAKLAKDQGVYPTQQELDRQYDAIKKQGGGDKFEQQARDSGLDPAAVKKELLRSLTVMNVLCRGVNVTDDEIKQQFDKQKNAMTQPEMIEVSEITLTSDKDRDAAVNDLNGNAAFALVAKSRSKDRYQQEGGKVPGTFGRQVPPESPVPQQVVDAAFKLKPGAHSDPIKVGGTWVIVQLDKKNESKEPPFEDFKELIRTQVRQQKAQSTGKLQENQRVYMKAMQDAKLEVYPEKYKVIERMRAGGLQGAPGGGGGAGAPPGPPGG